jgi:transposase, IS6 family
MKHENETFPAIFTGEPSQALKELKAAGIVPEQCELPQVKDLNNLGEQDPRFIKRLTKPRMGFLALETAWRTLQGYEIINMRRKGQVRGVDKGDIPDQILFIASLVEMAA